jgi:starvation-inducible DNA-binding protein
MDKFVNQLKIAFASQYAFAIKAQNFHWNVEGSDFYQLHNMFEDIYNEVYGTIDAFAENIRKIKSYTPASLYRFSALSAVDDEVEILDPQAMVAELLRDAEKMQEIMKVLFVEAETLGHHGLSNFLADRQDAFAKHAWFLRSTAKA